MIGRNAALHEAVLHGRQEIVSMLIEHPRINLNIQDALGLTPLHAAIRYREIEIAGMLIEHPRIKLT